MDYWQMQLVSSYLKSLLKQEGEQRENGLCKPEQPVLQSLLVPAAMGTWEESLVSKWWLGGLGLKAQFGRNGDIWDQAYRKKRDFFASDLEGTQYEDRKVK